MAIPQASVSEEPAPRPSTLLNSSDIALVPYARVGGQWTLADQTVRAIGALAERQGVLATVFPDGSVRTADDFLASMQSPANVPVFAFRAADCVGVAWLNGCANYHAFGHFLFFEGQRGETARTAGRLILKYWFSFMAADRAMFDVILGLVPSANPRAIRFAQDIGLTRLCEIPRMLHGRAATLLYLER